MKKKSSAANEVFRKIVVSSVREAADSVRSLAEISSEIVQAAQALVACYRRKGKLVAFGNGGSAGDSQHLAAELVSRFEKERAALPALALTTNSSTLTAVGNDYDFIRVFARQVEAFVEKGDVVIAISTSGNSPNVLEGIKAARKAGAFVIGWTGLSGGKMAALCDVCLQVPSPRTCRIQEGHLVILHTLCSIIEEALFPEAKRSH